MGQIKKTLGKVPVGRGAYSATETYYKENTIQMYGMSFRALSDMRGVAPVSINSFGKVVLANTDKWELISGSVDTYNNAKDMQNLDNKVGTLEERIDNIKPVQIIGDVTNAADEEDLTVDGQLLKLKDRSNINGMGYIILRQNKTFKEQVTQPNTIYEIRYDFDLREETVEIPSNCVLKFEGGDILNGYVYGNGLKRIKSYDEDLMFVKLSTAGMIAGVNSNEVRMLNARILNSIILQKKNIIVDSVYYIEGTYEINYDFTITGQNGTIYIVNETTQGTFVPLAGSSVTIENVNFHLPERYGYALIKRENVNDIIEQIVINNCHFKGGRVVNISGVDMDVNENPFGIKKFAFTNCKVRNCLYSTVNIVDIVCFEAYHISYNDVMEVFSVPFALAATNEFSHSSNNSEKNCTLNVRNNYYNNNYKVANSNSYVCLFLTDYRTTVNFDSNIIEGVINCPQDAEHGTCYDIYAACKDLNYTNNTVTDIACIPLTKVRSDMYALGYSKMGVEGSTRIYHNNKWSIDFDKIKSVIDDITPFTSEEWSAVAGLRIFPFYSLIELLEFTSNTVIIKGGTLLEKNNTATKKAILKNNNFIIDTIEMSFFRNSQIDFICKEFIFTENNVETNSNRISLGYMEIGIANKIAQSDTNLFVANNTFSKPLMFTDCAVNSIKCFNNHYPLTVKESALRPKLICKNKSMLEYSESLDYYALSPTILVEPLELRTDFNLENLSNNFGFSAFKFDYAAGVDNLFTVLGEITCNGLSHRFMASYDCNDTCIYVDDKSKDAINISNTSFKRVYSSNSFALEVMYDKTYHRIRFLIYANGNKLSMNLKQVKNDYQFWNVGDSYFNTTLNKSIWWNGTAWVDSNGTQV